MLPKSLGRKIFQKSKPPSPHLGVQSALQTATDTFLEPQKLDFTNSIFDLFCVHFDPIKIASQVDIVFKPAENQSCFTQRGFQI